MVVRSAKSPCPPRPGCPKVGSDQTTRLWGMGPFRVAERTLEHPRVQLKKRAASRHDPKVMSPPPNAGIEHVENCSHLRLQTLTPGDAQLLPDFLDRVFTGGDAQSVACATGLRRRRAADMESQKIEPLAEVHDL